MFYPTDLSIDDFYMSYDIKLFIDTVKVSKGEIIIIVFMPPSSLSLLSSF